MLLLLVVVDIFLHIVCQVPLVLIPHSTCIHKPKPECKSQLEERHRLLHTLGCRPNPISHLQAYNALEKFEWLFTNTFHQFYHSKIVICICMRRLQQLLPFEFGYRQTALAIKKHTKIRMFFNILESRSSCNRLNTECSLQVTRSLLYPSAVTHELRFNEVLTEN